MKSFLKSLVYDIRGQSPAIRNVMFALCVVSVISLTGVLWFDSFEKRLYFGLNLDPQDRERFLAERNGGDNQVSMFSDIGQIFSNFRSMTADIFSLFTLPEIDSQSQDSEPHKLPLSEDK